jgi:hypothetical protein
MLHYRRRHSLRRSQRKARRMGCSVPGKKKNHSMTSASSTAGNSQSASARRAMVLISALAQSAACAAQRASAIPGNWNDEAKPGSRNLTLAGIVRHNQMTNNAAP